MIYNKSFLRKELKESYFENSISLRNSIKYSLFLALVSFGVHFIMLTLNRSVLSEVAPQLIDPSYFSVISIYLRICYFFYVVYLAANYNFLTFSELKNNKWYILIKFGFSPVKMIFTKLYARLVTVFFVYSLGFVTTIFLTYILKYPFIIEYMVPLFILGFTDIVTIMVITLTSSLYFTKGVKSDYVMVFSVIFLFILRYSLGYYGIINDKSRFNSFFVLKEFTNYIVILLAVNIICLVIIFFIAKIKSKYYYFSFYIRDLDFADGVKVVMGGKSKLKFLKEYSIDAKKREKVVSRILNSFIISIITLFVLFNIFVLVISISSRIQNTPIINIIPYVFHSDTMEPSISYNDLAMFKKFQAGESLNTGDIVLYQSNNNEVSIARIQSFSNNKIIVDIDNYPPGYTASAYREAISTNQISGKYAGRSRWLGLLILFANTTLGRFLLLLIPSILLFYYKPITEFLQFISYQNSRDKS